MHNYKPQARIKLSPHKIYFTELQRLSILIMGIILSFFPMQIGSIMAAHMWLFSVLSDLSLNELKYDNNGFMTQTIISL